MVPNWANASCRNLDTDDIDIFFGNGLDGLLATEVCEHCPIQLSCRDYARSEGIPFGIWGGEGAAARKKWWRKNGGRPRNFFNDIESLALVPAKAADSVGPDPDAVRYCNYNHPINGDNAATERVWSNREKAYVPYTRCRTCLNEQKRQSYRRIGRADRRKSA